MDRAEGLEQDPVYSNLWITYRLLNPKLASSYYVYQVSDRKYTQVVRQTGLPERIYLVKSLESPAGWENLKGISR